MKKLTKFFLVIGMTLTISVIAREKGKDRRGGRGMRGMISGMGGMDIEAIQKEIQELRKKSDANGDGKLDKDERKAFMTNIREFRKTKREEFMKKWDTDEDGELSEEERAAMQQKMAEDEFEKIDLNDDGVIDKKEFMENKEKRRKSMDDMRKKMMEMRANFRKDRKGGKNDENGTIERYDENGDGVVDEAERMKAAKSIVERMERKGLSKKWTKFDTDGNGTLSQDEKDALTKEIAERLEKKIQNKKDKKGRQIVPPAESKK